VGFDTPLGVGRALERGLKQNCCSTAKIYAMMQACQQETARRAMAVLATIEWLPNTKGRNGAHLQSVDCGK
jgi:hypothetical protein